MKFIYVLFNFLIIIVYLVFNFLSASVKQTSDRSVCRMCSILVPYNNVYVTLSQYLVNLVTLSSLILPGVVFSMYQVRCIQTRAYPAYERKEPRDHIIREFGVLRIAYLLAFFYIIILQ